MGKTKTKCKHENAVAKGAGLYCFDCGGAWWVVIKDEMTIAEAERMFPTAKAKRGRMAEMHEIGERLRKGISDCQCVYCIRRRVAAIAEKDLEERLRKGDANKQA